MSVNSGTPIKPICVAGVYVKNDKYPNVKYKLQCLRRLGADLLELNRPAITADQQWGGGGFIKKVFRYVYCTLVVLVGCINKRSEYSVLYVPYPGLSLCFFLSFIPRFLRPRPIVLDFFISIYDTVVLNRKLLREGSLPARLLWWVEKRSLSVVDVMVVDTAQNADFMSQLFALDKRKLVSVPLAIGAMVDGSASYNNSTPTLSEFEAVSQGNQINVLFVGTMVPLHGIETILQASNQLQGKSIKVTLLGDGQDAGKVSHFLALNPQCPVHWIRDWQSTERMAQRISDADICLGIFSDDDKAHRVCPLKIYHYMRLGKPIITGATDWSAALAAGIDVMPMVTVPCEDADALAEAILTLAEKPEERASYGQSASEYYQHYLNDEVGGAQLLKLLRAAAVAGEG